MTGGCLLTRVWLTCILCISWLCNGIFSGYMQFNRASMQTVLKSDRIELFWKLTDYS